MYEIVIAVLIIVIFVIIIEMQKRINTLRDSYKEFLTQYAVYIKAVGDHSEAVQKVLEDLDNKAEKSYYAVTALAMYVEYLEEQLAELRGDRNAL